MSPRPGPRRPIVGVRIGEQALAYIDELAAKASVNRSEMIRVLLREAREARAKPQRASRRATIR